MDRETDQYFLSRSEPDKSTLLSLRQIILAFDPLITETWKYKMPCYCYRGKTLCYVWIHKKFKQPYLLIVNGNLIDHPKLLTEKRARMKILLVDPGKDLPVKLIRTVLKKAIELA